MKTKHIKMVFYLFWLFNILSDFTDRQEFGQKTVKTDYSCMGIVKYRPSMSDKKWNINKKCTKYKNFDWKLIFFFFFHLRKGMNCFQIQRKKITPLEVKQDLSIFNIDKRLTTDVQENVSLFWILPFLNTTR